MTQKNFGYFVFAIVVSVGAPTVFAQSIVDGKTNLITNGDAEAGPAGMDVKTAVPSIPSWKVTGGKPTVLPYNLTGFVQLTDPTPPNHGFQYFAAAFPSLPATMTQDIDVSSASALIDTGNVKFTASAYLGNIGGVSVGTKMDVAFKNSQGQTFSTTTVGPLTVPFGGGAIGMFFQQQIGLVPQGTVTITITLTLQDGNYDTGVADSLSLVLSQLSTTPMLGTNLVVNGGAETGTAVPLRGRSTNVPGWSTTTFAASIAPYGGTGWISTTAPGPPDRGVNLFCGWLDNAVLYQDVDVSGAGSLIDSGQVTFQISGWLGGVGSPYASIEYVFYDWSGKPLAPTAEVTVPRGGTALVEASQSGPLPSGTRRVRITLHFPSLNSIADNIAFALAAPSGPPVITAGGIISASAFGAFSTIAPGTWIEIYGSELASTTGSWSGSDFPNGVGPTKLDGVSVSVGGKAAFIDYVSPTQVNALVPSDAPFGAGTIDVTLTNANGTSDPFALYVNQTQPGLLAPATFQVKGKQYVAALLTDGKTFALPAGAVSGVASQPASPGDVVTIYGIGFGEVTPNFDAGTIVTSQNSLNAPLQIFFGQTAAKINYDGLAPSFTGLYQFNVVVPNVSANDATPISINLGGVAGTQTLYIAVGK